MLERKLISKSELSQKINSKFNLIIIWNFFRRLVSWAKRKGRNAHLHYYHLNVSYPVPSEFVVDKRSFVVSWRTSFVLFPLMLIKQIIYIPVWFQCVILLNSHSIEFSIVWHETLRETNTKWEILKNYDLQKSGIL